MMSTESHHSENGKTILSVLCSKQKAFLRSLGGLTTRRSKNFHTPNFSIGIRILKALISIQVRFNVIKGDDGILEANDAHAFSS